MRTKTLLMTAAALAAGVIYSQAQSTVYSQNVVGYIDPPIPAHSYFEFANQLNPDSADVPPNAASNAINMALSSGMVSDPNGPPSGSNTEVLVFNGTTYLPYYYFNLADGASYGVNGTTAGWYDISGNPSPTVLSQGTSVFLYNNFTAPIATMSVGQVIQAAYGSIVATVGSTVPTGYSLLSLSDPISTNIDAAGIGLPDTKLSSDPNGPPAGHNDQYLFWNGSTYLPFYYFNVADGASYGVNGTTAGFYDISGNPVPAADYPEVGQGYVFYHYGSSFTYTNTFVVH